MRNLRNKKYQTIFIILSIFIFSNICIAAPSVKTGSIKGVVIDAETQTTIPGASVSIVNSDKGAATNNNGEFKVKNVPVGTYNVSVRSIGYQPVTKTDIIIRSGRITIVEVALPLAYVEVDDIKVTAGYFPDKPGTSTSTTNFSGEEIRRSPGTAGDVSRIMMTLPSIAKVNDQMNSLVVRGGNPTENAFYVDNIEIPNINHYPLQGSSGGPISLINVDFIKNVNFSAGGFSSAYGNRLSSVMDINFREGNRENYNFQLGMHMAGIDLLAEGPIVKNKGSFMLSARRSYLDLIVDAVGVGVAPRYSDYQGKITYDLSSTNKLSALFVYGKDFIEFTREDSEDEGNPVYGVSDGYEYAGGINWKWLWSTKGYSNTSISQLGTKYGNDFYETRPDGDPNVVRKLVEQQTTEEILQLRNVNYYRFNANHSLEFGFDLKYFMDNYDSWLSDYTNVLGEYVDSLRIKKSYNEPKFGGFVSYTLKTLSKITTTFGLRYDHFDYNKQDHIAPRFSLAYQITPRTTINLATGIYYQNLPLSLLAINENYTKFDDPIAYHYILGLSHLLTENTRVVVEGYYKEYDNFPLDPDQPQFFVSDEIVYRNFTGNMQNLTNDGQAKSYGVEVTVQKKLVKGIYGLVSGSYFRSEYKDNDGTWRNRIFDNQFLFNVEGGYKPNNKWEYSLRWIFAGGAPYTPLDLTASEAIHRNVLDGDRVNEERYAAYHSLNIRVDRRFNFSGSNLIVYLSVWNAYGRKNISTYYWNEVESKEDVLYQWSTLPILGMEFEF